jgi:ABC-type transporter Mla subunit MlaD
MEPEHLHRTAAALGTLADALDTERSTHATTQQQLAEEQAAHAATAEQLATTAGLLDTERQAHEATTQAFQAYRDDVESTSGG